MKNQKYRIAMVIIATLMATFSIVGCSKENSDWKTTKSTNTEEAYQSFVARYPNGKHAVDAIDAAENLAWKDTQSQNSEEAYHSFISKYPDSKHTSDALGAAEKLAWEIADKSNTVASLESFITSYPKSSYLTEVQQRLVELRKFTGVDASCVIYFHGNGSALIMGNITYSISADLTTLGPALPSGPNIVVLFRNLTKEETLKANKVGGKPNAAYLITSTSQLEFLGDIDPALETEKVLKLCGFAWQHGASDYMSWQDFLNFVKPNN
jgi:hypothetical protein